MIYGKERGKKQDENKILMDYNCGYCGYGFHHYVFRIEYEDTKRSNISTQVRCPKCKNFLKTWRES
jgi:cytochrome c-type biogenesis protein CcmH/NrfF